ncbi:substrate-binding periplasmic protein [Motilimonas sp. 1_MG-2023]|uniref:substrate-binding periplasmic protein n=1 Tax=Motilimonas TaxID=1914248 RepID=UPI0026E32C6B|nr:transporter substrate-binding domain-containing protein [Motilimonas sp. 1_MG-2023]MDO6525292.1 transporter substrate-binding domain-containing protein [Motilimonas sp. 1_MG-2023]
MKYLLCGLWLLSQTLWAVTIEVVTEEYPPYNYLEQGQVKGISTAIVAATLERAEYDYKITILPWSRAYHQTQKNPNTLIYSISRSQQREPYFHWIGVIADIQYHFFTLSSRQDIQPFNQLKEAKKFNIGSTRDDHVEQFLVLQGFKKLQRNNSHEANLEKLLMDRIDLWPVAKETASYYLHKRALDLSNELKIVYTIKDFSDNKLYIAMGLHTDIEVVKKIRKALNEIKQDGTYDKLIKEY